MSKAWMPIYWSDYFADTLHLSANESGAYLHLIGYYWITGKPLPDDHDILCRIAKVHPPHWPRVWKVLQPFFESKTPGSWNQKRIDLELAKNAEISNKRKAAAEQMLSKRAANAEQMLTQSQSQRKKEKENPKERSPPPNGGSPSDDGGFVRFWDCYQFKKGRGQAERAFRKAIKKTTLEVMLAAIERQKPQRKPGFVKHPATWLNGECWADEDNVIPIGPKRMEGFV